MTEPAPMTEAAPITTAKRRRLTHDQPETRAEPRNPAGEPGTSHDSSHSDPAEAPDTARVGGAARGYSWAAFEPGNAAAQTHGARSPRAVSALAAQLAQAAVDASPALALARFRFALDAWATAEARRVLMADYLDAHALVNNRGTPRASLLDRLAAAERAAARGRDELGLSPESAARIALALRAAGADLLSPAERHELLPLTERQERP